MGLAFPLLLMGSGEGGVVSGGGDASGRAPPPAPQPPSWGQTSERAVEAEASPGEAGSQPEGRDHRGRRHQPSQLGSQ